PRRHLSRHGLGTQGRLRRRRRALPLSRQTRVEYEAQVLAERVLPGAGEGYGAAGADAGDPAVFDGVAVDGRAGPARQVRAALGPVEARAYERAAAGRREGDAESGEPLGAVAGKGQAAVEVQQAPLRHRL